VTACIGLVQEHDEVDQEVCAVWMVIGDDTAKGYGGFWGSAWSSVDMEEGREVCPVRGSAMG
jgi:hypothetical protein